MSNKNYTHIHLLVDASGSMENNKQATIDGINNFLEAQKKLQLPDKDRNLSFEEDMSDSAKITCTATLTTFQKESRSSHNQYSFGQQVLTPSTPGNGEPGENYVYTKIFEKKDINEYVPMGNDNYDPYGGTPLIDAFYRAITECQAFIAMLKEEDRPGRVIIVSHTDGIENNSEKHTKAQLKAKLDEVQAQNWQVIYLGADQDAIQEGAAYGITAGQTLSYANTNAGITRSFEMLTSNVMDKRSCLDTAAMYSCSVSDMAAHDDSGLVSGTGAVGSMSTSNLMGSGVNALSEMAKKAAEDAANTKNSKKDKGI